METLGELSKGSYVINSIALVDVSSLVFAIEPLKPNFSRVGIWWLDNGCFERDLV